MEALEANEQYQKYENQLLKDNYSRQNTEIFQQNNITSITRTYEDSKNNTATINAEIVGNEVTKVTLDREKNKNYLWLLLLIIAILAYFLYKKKKTVVEVEQKTAKHFDYTAEAKKMLSEAEELFEAGHYKNAYGKAAQALRMYLSHKNGLKKELTSYELLEHLKGKPLKKDVKECLDLCSLVEFAKYKANKKDFSKITSIAGKIIGRKS